MADVVPGDIFREIGFDTSMGPGGCKETIFFIRPLDGGRMPAVGREAILEFIAYWENQIGVAKDYLANNFNPRTHEWSSMSEADELLVDHSTGAKGLQADELLELFRKSWSQ